MDSCKGGMEIVLCRRAVCTACCCDMGLRSACSSTPAKTGQVVNQPAESGLPAVSKALASYHSSAAAVMACSLSTPGCSFPLVVAHHCMAVHVLRHCLPSVCGLVWGPCCCPPAAHLFPQTQCSAWQQACLAPRGHCGQQRAAAGAYQGWIQGGQAN